MPQAVLPMIVAQGNIRCSTCHAVLEAPDSLTVLERSLVQVRCSLSTSCLCKHRTQQQSVPWQDSLFVRKAQHLFCKHHVEAHGSGFANPALDRVARY